MAQAPPYAPHRHNPAEQHPSHQLTDENHLEPGSVRPWMKLKLGIYRPKVEKAS